MFIAGILHLSLPLFVVEKEQPFHLVYLLSPLGYLEINKRFNGNEEFFFFIKFALVEDTMYAEI